MENNQPIKVEQTDTNGNSDINKIKDEAVTTKTSPNQKNSNNSSNSNTNNNSRSKSGDRGGYGANRRGSGGPRRDRSRRRSRSPVRSSSNRAENRFNSKVNQRVYVANIPFDVRWGEIKDLFREKVGNVRFCQLFENEEGKSRGCGIVEFEDANSAKKAIEVLNRFNFKGRELVVKEDLDIERDRYGRLVVNSNRDDYRGGDYHRSGGRGDRDNYHPHRDNRYDDPYSNGSDASRSVGQQAPYNTYGLSPQFLNSLGIKGPLNNRIFVANLDFKVKERHLEDVFRLAGKVTRVRLYVDNEGNSKGFGVVEFEHPVEAVQAISMFNNHKLYDRLMSVRLDKFDQEDPFGSDGLPPKLPRGLESIGKGLGIGGQPLNIKSAALPQIVGAGPPVQPPAGPVPMAPAAAPGSVNPQAAQALNVLSNLAGLQNLPALSQSFAQMTNPVGGTGSASTMPISQTTVPSSTTAAYSTGTDQPASSYASAYSIAPPPHGNGAQQPASYQTAGQMIATSSQPPSSNYGPPPPVSANVTSSIPPPYPSSQGGNVPQSTPISSYSTYDQRGDYRDVDNNKYRNSTGIDTIFIRNLPMNFTWQNLRDRFSDYGEVRYAEMKSHNTGLVRFVSDRDAQRAVDLANGMRIENRVIEVSLYY